MNLRWGHSVSETEYKGYLIVVRKRNIFYKGIIRDEQGNTLWWTPFCESEDKATALAKEFIEMRKEK